MVHAREDYNRIQDPANKIAEDEPVFLIRAKDKLAPMAILTYAEALERKGGGEDMVRGIREFVGKVLDWQGENGCKMPDL